MVSGWNLLESEIVNSLTNKLHSSTHFAKSLDSYSLIEGSEVEYSIFCGDIVYSVNGKQNIYGSKVNGSLYLRTDSEEARINSAKWIISSQLKINQDKITIIDIDVVEDTNKYLWVSSNKAGKYFIGSVYAFENRLIGLEYDRGDNCYAIMKGVEYDRVEIL